MYCKHCGTQIDDDSIFCKYCGKEINKELNKENKTNAKEKNHGCLAVIIFILLFIGIFTIPFIIDKIESCNDNTKDSKYEDSNNDYKEPQLFTRDPHIPLQK